MADFNLSDLKSWRKMHGVTQQFLADAASVGINTIGQIETGAAKIRDKTLARIVKAIRDIEAKAETAVGHLRREPAAVEPSPAPVPAPVIDAPPRQVAPAPTIRLTNIDIELISRVIQMTPSEKIKLLQSFMD